MTAPVFVDTNVHFYAFDDTDPVKRDVARAWRVSLWGSGRGRTSFQVLQEFYFQASRKFPHAKDAIRAEVRNLLTWRPVPIDASILQSSWDVQDRFRLSFWDALIVAAAQSASCRYLLTEDLQADQDLDGIQIVNPFLRTFESLD